MPVPMSVSAKNALQGLLQARASLVQGLQNNLDANARAQVEIDRLTAEITSIVGEEKTRTKANAGDLKHIRIDADKSAFLSDAEVAAEEAEKAAKKAAAEAAKGAPVAPPDAPIPG